MHTFFLGCKFQEEKRSRVNFTFVLETEHFERVSSFLFLLLEYSTSDLHFILIMSEEVKVPLESCNHFSILILNS